MNLSKDTRSTLPWRGQWLGYICLAMLVFFTWLPQSYYAMVVYPWIVVWQVGFLSLGIWTIWMLRQFKKPFKLLGYGIDWAVGAIVIALILSGIFASFKVVAVWYIVLALCYVLLLYVFHNWINRGFCHIYIIWKAICIIGVISCLIGLIIWNILPKTFIDVPRIHLPMGHPNFVAGYIMLVLPLTIALAISNKGWQKIGAFAASALMLTVLFLTGSRGGFLGLLALAITTGIFFIISRQGKQRWLSLAGCVVMLVIVVIFALNNPRVQRIVKFNGFNSNAPLIQLKIDGQSQDRLLMLKAATNILKNRPLFGVGAGNMSRVYDLYRPIETGTGAAQVQQLHNTPVQILGELGLMGFSAYLFLITCLLRLWFKLYYQLTETRSRFLLYGVGGSFFAYSVATLTDYQLENISLSSHLVILVVLLIELANIDGFSQFNLVNNYYRRVISLVTITVLIASSLLWLPQTLALRLSKIANSNFVAGKLDIGYEKIASAASLVSWDPTYNLIAAIRVMQLKKSATDQKLYQELTELSGQHFEETVKAAPNDAFFNQMLGMIYRDLKDSESAIKYLRRSIQLAPRSTSYNYYLLGREYLKIEEKDKAITALALQSLIMPQFLTSSMWDDQPLSTVKNEVLQKNLSLLTELLQKIPVNANNFNGYSNYNSVYEKKVLLEWWSNQLNIDNLEKERLRPIVQALLLAEQEPQQALNILTSNIKSIENTDSLLLLQAWIQPDTYLDDYLKSSSGNLLNSLEKEILEKSTKQNINLKAWLKILQLKFESSKRKGFPLTYRNEEIAKASVVILPEEIREYSIIKNLSLFDDYFREIPELEFLINQIQTKELSLIHPTLNDFQLN